MIMYFQIEGYYEKINNLQDIANIIRYYYNSELADKMDEMLEDNDALEDRDYDTKRLEELEDIISDLANCRD